MTDTPELRQLSRRDVFLKSGLVAAGGLAVAACKSGDRTQLPDPDHATTSPDTTQGTVSSTTLPAEITTTVQERVFASPEQQAEVEGLELKRARFFNELTGAEIMAFKDTTHFYLDSDGLTAGKYYDKNLIEMHAIILGVYTVRAGDGFATLQEFGIISETGERFTETQIVDITDTTFLSLFPFFQIVSTPIVTRDDSDTYVLHDSRATDSIITERSTVVAEMRKRVGEPMTVYPATGDAFFEEGSGRTSGPRMTEVVSKVNKASLTRKIGEVVAEFTSDELVKYGVYKDDRPTPQALLNGFERYEDLFSVLPVGYGFSFFKDIATLV